MGKRATTGTLHTYEMIYAILHNKPTQLVIMVYVNGPARLALYSLLSSSLQVAALASEHQNLH